MYIKVFHCIYIL